MKGQDRGRLLAVLLVEDDEDLRSLMAKILTHSGFRVIAVSNGREAVEAYLGVNGRIDVIVLDVMMPLLDGSATLRELRRLGANAPVVVCSGLDRHEVRRRLQGDTIACLLQKPVSPSALCATVNNAIQSQIEPVAPFVSFGERHERPQDLPTDHGSGRRRVEGCQERPG